METKKTIQECIKEADEKKMQLVIVGTGSEIGKHAELLTRMKNSTDVLLVPVEDLTEEDQKKLDSKENMPIQEIIPYRANPIDLKAFDPVILNDDLHKPPFSGFRRKKFKPSHKKRK